MIRARVLLVLGLLSAACHGSALAQKKAKDGPVSAFFKDTALITVSRFDARDFDLRIPARRDSLRATLQRERELWRAQAPANYRFLLNVGCFCPGVRGWLLVEVRSGQSLKAWDRTGKTASLTDWNTVSIDQLFASLERSATIKGMVKVGFDPRWHFPTYVYTVTLPGPDMWSVYEARGLRPI